MREVRVKGAFLAMMVAAGVFGGGAAGQDGVPGLGRILSYQLDISRCKVPKMETVYRIVDILSSLGYNQFQLYMEHTFAYPQHEVVWREASPMTPVRRNGCGMTLRCSISWPVRSRRALPIPPDRISGRSSSRSTDAFG